MTKEAKKYIAVDLKSFYASVECRERGLDPMTTYLVVADMDRTEKTICLAVSPAMRAYGIPGRARLFEVMQKVREINEKRKKQAPGGKLIGKTSDDKVLRDSAQLALDYIVASPRMAWYMEYSTRIYQIYLKYIAPEDIHIYSIDEVFIDATKYLTLYKLSAGELAKKMILDILHTTGIPAAAGIGTNLYLSKIAMDIQAKHIPADENGVRIAELDEIQYRRLLWDHRPLTDFWRIGQGYARKLAENGLHTMGDIARCSLGRPDEYYNEDLLYRLFGVNAELLIDHAWGWEPCTIADIKAYKPASASMGSGQVFPSAYSWEKAGLVLREMADQLALELFDKGLAANQLILTVGYDKDNLSDPTIRNIYQGPIVRDSYGRRIPKAAHGTVNMPQATSSGRQITESVMGLFEGITDKNLLVRRLDLTAGKVVKEESVSMESKGEQINLFIDYDTREREQQEENKEREREKKAQKAVMDIKKKYGKNAILRGRDLEDGATARERNRQIGGHKA